MPVDLSHPSQYQLYHANNFPTKRLKVMKATIGILTEWPTDCNESVKHTHKLYRITMKDKMYALALSYRASW